MGVYSLDLKVTKKLNVFLIEACYYDEKRKNENEN